MVAAHLEVAQDSVSRIKFSGIDLEAIWFPPNNRKPVEATKHRRAFFINRTEKQNSEMKNSLEISSFASIPSSKQFQKRSFAVDELPKPIYYLAPSSAEGLV